MEFSNSGFLSSGSEYAKIVYGLATKEGYFGEREHRKDARLTTKIKAGCPVQSQEYEDGDAHLKDVSIDEFSVILFDVYGSEIEKKSNKLLLNQLAWGVLPLKGKDNPDYIANGYFYVPLMKGAIPENAAAKFAKSRWDDVLKEMMQDNKNPLKLMGTASLLVEVVDFQACLLRQKMTSSLHDTYLSSVVKNAKKYAFEKRAVASMGTKVEKIMARYSKKAKYEEYEQALNAKIVHSLELEHYDDLTVPENYSTKGKGKGKGKNKKDSKEEKKKKKKKRKDKNKDKDKDTEEENAEDEDDDEDKEEKEK